MRSIDDVIAFEGLHYSPGPSDQDIMLDLMTHGPITTCFTVYDDFLRYTGGVYKLKNGSKEMGGHCTKLIGWGVSGGDSGGAAAAAEEKVVPVPYWLVANEWSSSWGEGGYFRIARNDNGVSFPNQASAGFPDLHSGSFVVKIE